MAVPAGGSPAPSHVAFGSASGAGLPRERERARFAAMPLSLTQRERAVLTMIAVLIVLGAVGLAVL